MGTQSFYLTLFCSNWILLGLSHSRLLSGSQDRIPNPEESIVLKGQCAQEAEMGTGVAAPLRMPASVSGRVVCLFLPEEEKIVSSLLLNSLLCLWLPQWLLALPYLLPLHV